MRTDKPSRRLSLAKLTPPGVDACIARERLFRKIDALQKQAGLWISGPGGSGKTALVASYIVARKRPVLWMQLDDGDSDPATFFYYLRLAAETLVTEPASLPVLFAAENIPGLTRFARTFFRTLYQTVPGNCVLVFDDAQEQMLSEQANQLLAIAIEEAPKEINVIIISRDNMPEAFSGTLVRGKLALLGWSELSFHPEELRQLANKQISNIPCADTLTRKIERSKGWVAGFLLLLQKGQQQAMPPAMIDPSSEQALFNYFASEIFTELEQGEREFLLITAHLPILTSELAGRLSRCRDCRQKLERMVYLNYFTVAQPDAESTFEYHPLFKHFLQSQARLEYPDEKIIQIKNNAAHLLINSGHEEAAVPLLLETKDWQTLIEVMLAQAGKLLTQGRHLRLATWLDAIPDVYAEREPWFIYWQGVARMPVDLESSYQLLSKAYDDFLQVGELTGASMAWAGAIESLVHSLSDLARMDEWLLKLDSLLNKLLLNDATELKALLAPQVVAICALRAPDGIDIEPWLETTQGLLTQSIDPTQRITASFVLVAYFIWKGQPARAEQVLKLQEQILCEEAVRPLALITAKLSAAWHAWVGGERARCRTAIEEGLAIANETGVHHWTFILLIQGITNALLHGDTAEARTYLTQLDPLLVAARDFDRAYYHNELGWLEFLEGRPEKALLQQQLALEIAESVAAPYVTAEAAFGLSQAFHAINEPEQASRFLQQARLLADQYKSNTLTFQCGLLDAWYQYIRGDTETAASTLQETIKRASHHGYKGFAWWQQSQITELCIFALLKGIEPVFIRNLIREFGLRPPPDRYIPSDWPWPVRIETLGRFNLTIDGKALQFTSKAQHRPLDLIKALIALGAAGVSTERLAEVLWPDAEGDAANRNLQTTIHRVRKLLKYEDAIEVRQGLISLNPLICRVDTLALQTILKKIHTTQIDFLPILAREILELYKGPFLECEAEESWSISLREHLRGRMVKGLHQLAGRLGPTDTIVYASSLYETAISIEPLSEKSYRHLMGHHALTDNKAEALAVYTRLKQILQQQFNTTASQSTIRLAEAITLDDLATIRTLVSGNNQADIS